MFNALKAQKIIAEAIVLAQSAEGAAIISEAYGGEEDIGPDTQKLRVKVYSTQRAAALATLVKAIEEYDYDADELADLDTFSVHAVINVDGNIRYTADIGENPNLIFTDAWGFASFCNENYDFEDDWVEKLTA